jgi:hypothetical protein
MKKYAKVEGYENLVRDLETSAIINTDHISLNNYEKNKDLRKCQKQDIENLKSEVEYIKSSIDEIKFLLRGLNNESR